MKACTSVLRHQLDRMAGPAAELGGANVVHRLPEWLMDPVGRVEQFSIGRLMHPTDVPIPKPPQYSPKGGEVGPWRYRRSSVVTGASGADGGEGALRSFSSVRRTRSLGAVVNCRISALTNFRKRCDTNLRARMRSRFILGIALPFRGPHPPVPPVL